jgi:hypothetical protein
MTRYVLCRHAIGEPGEVEITEAEYHRLAMDIKTLVEVSDVEEKFNAFIDNYFELEKSSLEETLRAMIYEDSDTARFSDPRNRLNRHIINFLTAVKLYLDSFPQHANNLFRAGKDLEDLRAAPPRAYDRSISYRIMEALRNYSQHEAFPVHNWEVNFWKDTTVEPMLFRANINPSLNLTTLSEAKKFKKAVLEELVQAGGPTELKPIIREYVEQLCIVHAEFRAATKSMFAEAMGEITAARDKFLAQFPGSKVSVVALPVDEDGIKMGDPVYLNAHVIDYLPYLMSRVNSMVNYSRRRVEY